jgi:hypothetical protein
MTLHDAAHLGMLQHGRLPKEKARLPLSEIRLSEVAAFFQ